MVIPTNHCIRVVCEQSHKIASFEATNLVMQKLQEADCVASEQFCNWFCEAVCSCEVDPLLTYFTWFYLSGHVNTRNSRYWLEENSILIHEVTLHVVNVKV
jgi:hypothetical protein